ncbi:hypothetical protein [Cupriavidus sp. 8B]
MKKLPNVATSVGFLLVVSVTGCGAPGSRYSTEPYKEPTTTSVARLELQNRSNFAIGVGIFEDPRSCSGQSRIYYKTDRDDNQAPDIAGYKDGVPIYYKQVSMESPLLPTGRTLRGVAIEAKPMLLHLVTQTPADFNKKNWRTEYKYAQCDLYLKFTPKVSSVIHIQFGSDTQLAACDASAYSVEKDAGGNATATALPMETTSCDNLH